MILFGGSFDPIHLGHIEIIKEASKLDEVIVLPNYLNPLKNSFAAPADIRLKWIKKSIKDIQNVKVSDFEIKQNKPCYTIDTIKHFKQFYDKISFIIGADNLATLNKWKNIDELRNLIEFIVVTRDNIPIKEYKTINIDIPISSTEIRTNLDEKYLPNNIKKEVIEFYKNSKNKGTQ